MEWLGVVLLYLLSGFMKKRQQNARRREIESDPNWASDSGISLKTPFSFHQSSAYLSNKAYSLFFVLEVIKILVFCFNNYNSRNR